MKNLPVGEMECPFLNFAIQKIYNSNGTTSIDGLRQNIAASRRYVEKLFKKSIGLTPKRYARLIRVKKASILMQHEDFDGSIAGVAAALDYYDQSHFLKDFKMVVRKTPTQFLKTQAAMPMEGVGEYLRQWDYS